MLREGRGTKGQVHCPGCNKIGMGQQKKRTFLRPLFLLYFQVYIAVKRYSGFSGC